MHGAAITMTRNIRRVGVPATKRGRPNPAYQAAIHDRRAADALAAGEYASVTVDDPMALDPGDKITVLRQLRNDPLARLHSHHQIDEAQYMAGRCYQRDWERAERGARAIDPTKEAVDGGQLPEPLSDSQGKARIRLVQIERVLGRRTHRVVHAFLIDGWTMEDIAVKFFQRSGHRWANHYGKIIRDGLDELAVEYQLASK